MSAQMFFIVLAIAFVVCMVSFVYDLNHDALVFPLQGGD